MVNNDYHIWGHIDKSFRCNNFNNKRCKFVDVDMKPNNEPNNYDYFYWFHISTPLLVVEDATNEHDCFGINIRLVSHHEKIEDTLMLFEYHQNKTLLRKVFNSAIAQLERTGVIKEVKVKNDGWIIHYYDMDLDLSEEEKNDIF